ncbi:NAD(P)-dependent oxidoreductase [Pseudarthrobacter sp. NamE5]|uniref:NAD(P)-dependent oxidoreductase n=1 Tax=Pseudarthrobacter sp. NamE5 TaxID=2576839 RepID=UPI00110A3FDF|nr:NAD(P)-dependent oxidoreductase [Pseudarthrobacter sp. NamE5]TLM80769.1 phosphoglycerate dehydrogenase [Pseudarthrobacter sp. NamE5]
MKVLIPSTISLELPQEPDIAFHTYDVNAPVPAEHHDAEFLVAWQNPAAQLVRAAADLHRLQLVQALASGADAIMAAGFPQSVKICSGRSLHDGPVAEHTLALLFACIRRLDTLQRAKQAKTWDVEYARRQAQPETANNYTLSGASVLIWGFGSIAAKLAPVLTMLGVHVAGVASSAGNRGGHPVVTKEQARDLLPVTDVVISLLPATGGTKNYFNGEFFNCMRPGSVFINVGRGSTVDEADLISALNSGSLRVAAIDVAKEEPIPPASPLWTTKNLIITPHVAGNRPQNAMELISTNMKAIQTGAPLTNLQ